MQTKRFHYKGIEIVKQTYQAGSVYFIGRGKRVRAFRTLELAKVYVDTHLGYVKHVPGTVSTPVWLR